MKILTLILMTITLFTSNGLTYVIQNHEIINEVEEIPGRSLQSSALFGPILVTCIIATGVIISLSGTLITTLSLNDDREAKVILYENNYINERISINSATSTVAYISSFYGQSHDEFQDFNNNDNVKNEEYYNEIYEDYFHEEDDDNEITTTELPRSIIRMPNSPIPRINSNENTTQNTIPSSSIQFPPSVARTERKNVYFFI